MKKLVFLLILSLAIGTGYAQVNAKKEISITKSENGKAHVKIIESNGGKETVIDTMVTLDHGKIPLEIDKMIKDQKLGQQKIIIELDSTLKGQNFDFQFPDKIRAKVEHLRKDMRRNMQPDAFPRRFNLPDENMLKDFRFNDYDFPKNLRSPFLFGMSGRIHKLDDEEFARLRQKGVFTENDDLAEQLDVRFANLSPCGENCFVLNFASKEKGKIEVTLNDKEGKTISTSDASAVSSKEVNGRNVYSCVLNYDKDKKFTFIKLSKDGKLAVFTDNL